MNFEHTWVDGHTVLRFARFVAFALSCRGVGGVGVGVRRGVVPITSGCFVALANSSFGDRCFRGCSIPGVFCFVVIDILTIIGNKNKSPVFFYLVILSPPVSLSTYDMKDIYHSCFLTIKLLDCEGVLGFAVFLTKVLCCGGFDCTNVVLS